MSNLACRCLRRSGKSAAGVGALRRPRLHAGHDGHGAQPRPERRNGAGLAARGSRRPRFAYDSYRRFIQMYADVVLGVDTTTSRTSSRSTRTAKTMTSTPTSAPTTGARSSPATRRSSRKSSGKPFPQDPHEQLWGAIGAVFGSWMNAARHHLPQAARHPGDLGHGGQRPGHGVRQSGRRLRHRRCLHPQSVDRREGALRRVLVNAQGEDVVAGIRTPQPSPRKRAHRGRLRPAVAGKPCRKPLPS
jgi:pyruvate,orthophosphate dikinase